MKLRIILILLFFNFITNVFSQEKTKPLTDTKILRNVLIMDIEGEIYENVKVTLKSISPDYYFSTLYIVKVTIVDKTGRVVWKKTLKNAYLYVFADGQIQVGQPNFSMIIIYRNDSGSFKGKLRETEGVY